LKVVSLYICSPLCWFVCDRFLPIHDSELVYELRHKTIKQRRSSYLLAQLLVPKLTQLLLSVGLVGIYIV